MIIDYKKSDNVLLFIYNTHVHKKLLGCHPLPFIVIVKERGAKTFILGTKTSQQLNCKIIMEVSKSVTTTTCNNTITTYVLYM